MIKELLHLLYLSESDRTITQTHLDEKCQALDLIKGELDEILELAKIALTESKIDEVNNKIN